MDAEILKIINESNEEDIVKLVEKAKPAFIEIMKKAGNITKQFDGTEIYDVARIIQLDIQNYLEGRGDKIFKNSSKYAKAMGRADESKHKNEFLNNIDVEEGRNEILRRFQDLSEVMEEVSYDVRPTKEQIGLYSSIESIATDIMRTADYMQVSLEDE